jgi:uncharacterized membrane protein
MDNDRHIKSYGVLAVLAIVFPLFISLVSSIFMDLAGVFHLIPVICIGIVLIFTGGVMIMNWALDQFKVKG